MRAADPRACLFCGISFVPPWRRRGQRFCSRRCWLKSNHTPEHQRAATVARNIKSRGTGKKSPYVKRGGRHEHRVVAEQTLGRKLATGELVHHDDENGRNNSPENLIVMGRSAHAKLHFTGKKQSPEQVAKRVASRAATLAKRAVGQ